MCVWKDIVDVKQFGNFIGKQYKLHIITVLSNSVENFYIGWINEN